MPLSFVACYLLYLKLPTKLVEIIEKGKKLTYGNDILAENARFEGGDTARLWHLMPPRQEASVITVVCRPSEFSASSLARAVEDSDAHLLNLNVTGETRADGRMTIELRTSLRHADATARSLERYGYEVVSARSFPGGAFGDELDETMRSRAAELLHILEL